MDNKKINIKLLKLGILPTNCYLLSQENTNECILIDCAYNDGKLLSYLKDNNLNVVSILLTHGHFDHCGGVKSLINGLNHNINVYGNLNDKDLALNASKNQWKAHADGIEITNYVEDNEYIINGFTVKCITTPGHTAGGVCYLIDQYLFTGDTIFANDIGRTDLDSGNEKRLMESLKKIKTTIQTDYLLCPGHGDTSTYIRELFNNPYLKNL